MNHFEYFLNSIRGSFQEINEILRSPKGLPGILVSIWRSRRIMITAGIIPLVLAAAAFKAADSAPAICKGASNLAKSLSSEPSSGRDQNASRTELHNNLHQAA